MRGGEEKKQMSASLMLLDFPVSPLGVSSVSAVGWEGLFCQSRVLRNILDCNLHRSHWFSCMDVPVPECEPCGVGDGGERGGWGGG